MTARRLLSALPAGLVLGVVPALASAQAGTGYYGGHMWSGGWHGWFFGPLMMILWLVMLAGAVVLILRWLGVVRPSGAAHGKTAPDAIDILRERFARGEIDKAEFEERRALLEH